MGRWRRWIVAVVGSIGVVALSLAAALYLLVDRDGLRGLVVAAVKAQTGWHLEVEQPVGLSLDGGIGVVLRGLRLDGPAKGPLRAEALRLRLRPWPLLERRVEVEALSLEGLVVDWQGPQRIDASASLRFDAAAQTLVAEPLIAMLDGTPVTGLARWQGGLASEVTAVLRAEAIVVGGLRLHNLEARTVLRDGSLGQSLDAGLYGGSGTAMLESRLGVAPAPWSLRATLDEVRIHELARDLGQPVRLEGVATVEADLRWQGSSETALRRTMGGDVKLVLRDGVLKGIDLPHLIHRAGDLFDGKAADQVATGRTALTKLEASATIREGMLRNDDLHGEAPPFQLSGRGTVDLPAERLDYVLTATLPEAATGLGKRLRSLRGVPIPVQFFGPIADPKVALDLEAALQGAARLRLDRKLDERLDGKLGDKLKNLLGR